jgi:hypothetical protein
LLLNISATIPLTIRYLTLFFPIQWHNSGQETPCRENLTRKNAASCGLQYLSNPFHFSRYFTIKSDECFSILSLSEPLVERRAIERGAKLEIQKMKA